MTMTLSSSSSFPVTNDGVGGDSSSLSNAKEGADTDTSVKDGEGTVMGYAKSRLISALDSLSSSSSSDFPLDCVRHLHGYDESTGRLSNYHELSALQTITAVRILDYNAIQADPTSPSESDLLTKALSFRDRHGHVLDLGRVIRSESPSMALAAEFKRASPSKGDIAPDLVASEQAVKYATAGASIVSVLTEGRWFKGSLCDLTDARIATSTAAAAGDDDDDDDDDDDTRRRRRRGPVRPAILRKDFITSRYQIAEAAAAGADTVLLIVAVTPSSLLKDLIHYARTVAKVEPLVEVHADSELDVALDAGARIIGVNNRNLHTFQLDLGTTDRIAAELRRRGIAFDHSEIGKRSMDEDDEDGSRCSLCALSGMSTSEDVDRYRRCGVGMCLIGESLMRSPDPAAAIADLCLDPVDYAAQSKGGANGGVAGGEVGGVRGGAGGAYTAGTKLVKICGIATPRDAVEACRAGANLIGVIFAERSKRRVSAETASEIVAAVRNFGERDGRATVLTPLSGGKGGSTDPAAAAAHPLRSLSSKAWALENAAAKGRPLVVGVFQNQPEEYVRGMAERCGLDLVQLHGREGMEAANAEKCGVPAIRVVDVETDADTDGRDGDGGAASMTTAAAVEKLLDSLTSDPVAILLDTSIKGKKEGGGTGVAFDWTLAESIQSRGLPVIVAGGLTPDNVKDCVAKTRPWGVDVASGVEAEPGKKDLDKVRAFVARAREAAEEANKGF